MRHFKIYRKLILVLAVYTAILAVVAALFWKNSSVFPVLLGIAPILLCCLLFLLDFLHNRYDDDLLEKITLLIEALTEQQEPHVFPEDEDTLTARLQHQLLKLRNILIAHQFVTGASCCDSEELSIGGLDQVGVSVFAPFDYVALGHIHGPQHVGRETVRYCGTPLKYSFSEASQEKSVTVVELLEKGNVTVNTRPLRPLHDMRELRGSYEELTSRDFYQGTAVDDYLHITLTDEEDILDAIVKLRSIYPNVMKLDYDNKRTREGRVVEAAANADKPPIVLMEELYQLQNNQPMTEQQADFAVKLMEEIWEGSR